MKYNLIDEYKIFEEEPELKEFRKKVMAKPSGAAQYETYLQFRVLLKNDEDMLSRMDPHSNSYGSVKAIYDRRFKKLQEMERDLDAPQTNLQKFANAKGVLQTG